MMTATSDTIIVASYEELSSPHYYRRLWVAIKNINIPRREWLDEIADALRDYHGVFIDKRGHSFVFGDVDDIFGDDPELRWMSSYLQADTSGDNPKIRSQKYERLQLLDAYFKIRYPQIAKHFGR